MLNRYGSKEKTSKRKVKKPYKLTEISNKVNICSLSDSLIEEGINAEIVKKYGKYYLKESR